MTKLLIMGAAGRMGQALVRCALDHPEVLVAAALERSGHENVGDDAGLIAGCREIGVTICDNREETKPAEVMIDFTTHAVVRENMDLAVKNRLAVVLGTTGLTGEDREAVKGAARKVPVVWAPNMSLGVNVLLDLTTRAAAILGGSYDMEIVEMHHKHKLDAPSGTALALAESVVSGYPSDLPPDKRFRHGREGHSGTRTPEEIGIHALRGGDVVGDHTVIMAGDGERIELTHKASSRNAFAGGAIEAAIWVKGRSPGLYNMRHVLGLDEL